MICFGYFSKSNQLGIIMNVSWIEIQRSVNILELSKNLTCGQAFRYNRLRSILMFQSINQNNLFAY